MDGLIMRSLMPIKPCTGCGLCCQAGVCETGRKIYGSETPCKGLVWSKTDNRFYCELAMNDPSLYELLYIGYGCAIKQ